MVYDYRTGKSRIEEILSSPMAINESDKLPSIENLTYENAYHSWISAIFIDIRNSTEMFSDSRDREETVRAVRAFTSEIIEILRGDDLEREMGIRGDCVYAVYTTPKQNDINDLFTKACWVNTYLKMSNSLLSKHGFDTIRAGIGLATGHDHVIKAGRKNVGINATVWVGEAVAMASKLSAYGDKNGINRIVCSSLFYSNMIELLEKENPSKNPASWFHTSPYLPSGATHSDVVISEMNDWIEAGMPA